MTLWEKLEILGAAASYDHSCTGTGLAPDLPFTLEGRRHLPGIYLAHTSLGRRIPLLKVLLTNRCRLDCAYCVNRASNRVPRTAFEPRELAEVARELFRRGLVQGIFLSAAIQGCPDDTMERLVETARILRRDLSFRHYLHLKILPGVSPELVREAVRLATRVSVNLEFVKRRSLHRLAPGKEKGGLIRALAQAREFALEEGRIPSLTTQVIVGATPETDYDLLRTAQNLYRQGLLKRMYFSAYIPANRDPRLPPPGAPPPLLRERRLYQADYLLRLYGFDYRELLEPGKNLPLDRDPKLVWAERHPEFFPVDLLRASYEEILRVPGIGPRTARRILEARRRTVLTPEGLRRAGVQLSRALPFIALGGRYLPRQLSLF
ncbi:putative DNA modification/repair radical SAM protein [Thermosulfurimonas sp. F29]|uniref:putative DNA modification/repair radical SAM protein n=1 Tax=Thermosulfurimonas sp. F29 TaxID=2867247 RepID=UPI001C83E99C|nr:putative DNA modification/repair radical SAM protein [Thermosulfurimonas sp. F29]MBX6423887.1 putative DNA modification/repair radical SAM protein [Thermosulfurimonas sp. F29]